MSTLGSYWYSYKILLDYMRGNSANFLFQLLIFRYLEVTAILLICFVNTISSSASNTVAGIIASIQLFACLIINEGYTKIVPYLRILYLSRRIVPGYLLVNSIFPFLVYFVFSLCIIRDLQTVQSVSLITLLLLSNTLFGHIFHVFSFSFKEPLLFLSLVSCIYLCVFLGVSDLVVLGLTVVAVMLFSFMMYNY